MFEKTTSPKFKQFGLCLSQDIDPINMNFYEFSNKSVTNLNITTKDDTYIKTINGLTMILVATDPNNIYSFILNRPIKLKKGIYFNFISISNKSLISISNTINSYSFLSLSQSYIYSSISSSLNITEIYTKFYQEKGINYRFNGESHPYWELTYVDKGCLYTNVNNSTYVLNQGDLMFYSPFQFHTQYTLDNESCSYLTINFNMEFDKFKLLCDKVFTLDRTSYSTINFLIKELSLSDIYSDDLSLCYLKQLIINILRTKNLSSYSKPTTHMQ
ncbi:cupin domain-containing protein, partial [Paraclostridium bifermentans]